MPWFRLSMSRSGWNNSIFAVTDEMVAALASIGITVSDHALYLTVTSRGAVKIVPVRQADADGEQNEYARTKEIGLMQRNSPSGCGSTPTTRTGSTRSSGAERSLRRPQWPEPESREGSFGSRSRQGPPDRQPATQLFQKWAARDTDPK